MILKIYTSRKSVAFAKSWFEKDHFCMWGGKISNKKNIYYIGQEGIQQD